MIFCGRSGRIRYTDYVGSPRSGQANLTDFVEISNMAKPRVLILRAPGANCDMETEFAFEQAGGLPERIHVYRLREKPEMLLRYQVLVIPGGFTYGDDVAAGKILANQL